jgi:hypothetical protein
MILEKSMDYGITWQVWQYYDVTCDKYYSTGSANRTVADDKPEAVICDQRYSQEVPYKDGQVVFPITTDRMGLYMGQGLSNYSRLYEAYMNTRLKDFLTFTDIRIR